MNSSCGAAAAAAPYLLRWSDPAALSQLLGALIASGIAIVLWKAERQRLLREKHEEALARRDHFRAMFLAGVRRLDRELTGLTTYIATIRTSIKAQVGNGNWDKRGTAQYIESIPLRFPINVPNSFEFSDLHLSALTTTEASSLQLVKDELLDYHIALRTLISDSQTVASADAQIEQLNVVDGHAHEVIRRLKDMVDSFSGGP